MNLCWCCIVWWWMMNDEWSVIWWVLCPPQVRIMGRGKPSLSLTLSQKEVMKQEMIPSPLLISESTTTGVALIISELGATGVALMISESAMTQFSLTISAFAENHMRCWIVLSVADKRIFSMYIFHYSCLIFKYFGYVAQEN